MKRGLLKFLVLKKNYKMMGNSVSRYVSAVKTSEIHITSVIIFHFGVHKGCCYALRVFMLRSHLCSCTFLPHLDTISFPNHTHTPIYVLPLTSLFNFFYSATIFHPLPLRMHFFGGGWCNIKPLALVQMQIWFTSFWHFDLRQDFFFLWEKGEIGRKKDLLGL